MESKALKYVSVEIPKAEARDFGIETKSFLKQSSINSSVDKFIDTRNSQVYKVKKILSDSWK